jgi:arsenate reductase (thioredoxin)
MEPGVLYICLGNSCRSIMAEALTRHLMVGTLHAASAGLNPLGFITGETLAVLAEVGAATDGLYSKGIDAVHPRDYALIVNLSDYAAAPFLPPDCRPRAIQRPVIDPYGGSLDLYRAARDAIKGLILGEITAFFGRPRPAPHT